MKQIGQGEFSSVYRITRHALKQEYAIKVFNDDIQQDKVDAYIDSIHLRDCPFVIPLYKQNIDEIAEFNGKKFIILENMEHGTIYDEIMCKSMYNKDTEYINGSKMSWIYGIARYINYLHRKGFTHSDVTLKRFYLSSDYHLYCDDAESRKIINNTQIVESATQTSIVECLGQGQTDDIFNIGIVFYEILMDKILSNENIENGVISNENMILMINEMEKQIPNSFCDLISRCLSSNIDQRPNSEDIVKFIEERNSLVGVNYQFSSYVITIPPVSVDYCHHPCYNELGWKYNKDKQYFQGFHCFAVDEHINHNKTSQFKLGYYFDLGRGITQNFNEAVHYYKLSADQGYADAYYNLGILYEHGYGVDQDYNEAFKCYEFAAEHGVSEAQFNLAVFYQNGLGVERDTIKSCHWFEESARIGYTEAITSLGVCYLNGVGYDKDYQKAIELFKQAAEKNDGLAFYYLGICYQQGLGVEKDINIAIQYYKEGALAGNVQSQSSIGAIYYFGDEIRRNYKEAVKYLQMASMNNNMESRIILAYCYKEGKGVKKNYRLAVEYILPAVEQGYADAQCFLGTMYENGWGVEQNNEEAAILYQLAADQNESTALFNLGRLYENGIGVPMDKSKALECYKRSASQNDPNGDYAYALYSLDSGDQSEAIKLLNQAAEQGNKDAQLKLADCYERGIGVEMNYRAALRYYCLAADGKSNNVDSNDNLLEFQLNPPLYD